MDSFGPRHYVPVLKCKPGEKAALTRLDDHIRARLTPLVEIVEIDKKKKVKKTLAEHLKAAVKGLATAIGSRGCFLDTRELEPLGPNAAADAFAAVDAAGVEFVPVTGITRAMDVAVALTYRKRGVCLRVTRKEFEAGILPTALSTFVTEKNLTETQVDIVLDLGEVNNMVAAGSMRLALEFLRTLPSPTEWRSLTILGSSFPKSMAVVGANEDLLIDRLCWDTWRRLHTRRSSLSRLPTFGDFAIQHPAGVEGFDPRIMQMSPTIRYTTMNRWLVIKGESTRRVIPSIQLPNLARQLVPHGPLSAHFRGAGHCAGCDDADASASGRARHNSMAAWRRIGTSHHLTTVVEQIASLPWP